MAMRAGGGSGRVVNYLFIDGGYLTEVLKRFSKQYFDLDEPLPIVYSRLGAGAMKVFYYNAPPPRGRSNGADEPEADWERKLAVYEKFIDQLTEQQGWRVFHGIARRDRKGQSASQKEVDVQLAVDLLTHSTRSNMETATLLAGDLDFRPLLEAVAREGMYVTLWYEPASTNKLLRAAADGKQEFTVFNLSLIHI